MFPLYIQVLFFYYLIKCSHLTSRLLMTDVESPRLSKGGYGWEILVTLVMIKGEKIREITDFYMI